MSIKVLSHYVDSCPRKSTEKLLLIILADYCDDDGFCCPGQETLARKMNMSVSGVRKLLRKLRDAGEIQIQQNAGIKTESGATNRYRLMAYVMGVPTVAPTEGYKGVPNDPQGCPKRPARVSQASDDDPSVLDPSVLDPSEGGSSDLYSGDQASAERGSPPPDSLSQMMIKICDANGLAYLTPKKKIEVESAAKRLHEYGCTPSHVDSWLKYCYQFKDRPHISQIINGAMQVRREGIRAGDTSDPNHPCWGNSTPPSNELILSREWSVDEITI